MLSEKEKPLCSRQRFIVIFCFQNSQANNADAATIKALPASDSSIGVANGHNKRRSCRLCIAAIQQREESRKVAQPGKNHTNAAADSIQKIKYKFCHIQQHNHGQHK